MAYGLPDGGIFDIPACYEGLEATVIIVNGGSFTIRAENDAIGAAAKTDEAKGGGGMNGNPYVKAVINGGAFTGGYPRGHW